MKKQFLFNICLLILLNLLVKPFWVLGIDRSVQNLVGSESYGLYFALFNFTILFNSFLDLGITNFNNRSIAQTPALINHYFPRLILIKLLLGIFYFVLCFGISFWIGYRNETFLLLSILAFNQFLASLLLFFRSNITGLQLYTTDSIISIIDRLLLIGLCSMMLWTNLFPFKLNILVFALSQSFAYGLTCVIAVFIILKKSNNIKFNNIPIFSRNLFRRSLPFALLGLLMAFHTRIDAIFIERFLPNGAKEAGIYAQSFRIFDAINMISVLFASLLLPMFSRLIANKESVSPLLKLSFSMLFSGTAILSIIISVFSAPILDALYIETHPQSVTVFVLLSICIIPVSLSYIFGTLLTANGNLKQLNIIAGTTLIINVTLNIILIPKLGITGAAISALFSQLFAAITQIFICKLKLQIYFRWNKVWSYLSLYAVTVALALIFHSLKIGLGMKLFLPLILSIPLIFAFKIMSIKEIISAFNAENQHR